MSTVGKFWDLSEKIGERELWNARDRNLLLDTSAVGVLKALGIKDLMVSAIHDFGFINGLGEDARFYPLARGWISDLVLDVQMGRAFQVVGALGEIESALLKEYLRRGGHIEFAADPNSFFPGARLKVFAGGSKSSQDFDFVNGSNELEFKSARYFVANIERSRVQWSRTPENVSPVIFNFNADPNFPYTIAAMSHREKSTLYVTPHPGQSGDRDHSVEEVVRLMDSALKILGISPAGPIVAQAFESRVRVRERYVFGENGIGVLIGDAAHTTYPATGLGLSMAFSDVVRLQPLFLAMKGENKQTLSEALVNFDKEMRIYHLRLESLTHKAVKSMADVANLSRQNLYRFLFKRGKATLAAYFLSGWGREFQKGIVSLEALNVIDLEMQLRSEPHGAALLEMIKLQKSFRDFDSIGCSTRLSRISSQSETSKSSGK